MAFTDPPVANEECNGKCNYNLITAGNVSSPSTPSDNNNNSYSSSDNNNNDTTTADFIDKISNLGNSKQSIVAKLEEMERCMDYLQKQLQEHAGCINELDYSFPSQKRGTGNSNEHEERWLDTGCGLFPFIQKCLRNEKRYYSIIKWTNEGEKEFKIVDPEQLASLWGEEKRKAGMTKRKLTRSLAYLVNVKKQLRRMSTRTFIYQIVACKSEESCDYSSHDDSSDSPSTLPDEQIQLQTEKYIPMQALKKIIRENPKKYLQLFNEVQLQQQEKKNVVPKTNFQVAGTKRSLETSFDAASQNNLYFDFKMPKLQQQLTSFATSLFPQQSQQQVQQQQQQQQFTNNVYNQNALSKLPWSQMFPDTQSPNSDYSVACSPNSSLGSEANNSNMYMGSPLSISEAPTACFSTEDATFLQQSTQSTAVSSNLNPLTHALLSEFNVGNLSTINPTFCLTGPTSTTSDFTNLYLGSI